MGIIDRIRTWRMRRHLRHDHGYAIYEGDDTDASGDPIDAWMAISPLFPLQSQHLDDHGNYEGGGGKHKHHHGPNTHHRQEA